MYKLIGALVCGVIVILAGCKGKTNEDKVEDMLRNSPFFTSLGKFAEKSDKPTNPQGKGKGTPWPINIWSEVQEPTTDLDIDISAGKATVDVDIDWDVVMKVVYTDTDDTTYRDTVSKPAPQYHGNMSFYFEYDKKWELKELSLCPIASDSCGNLVSIDSVCVIDGADTTKIADPTQRLDVENWPLSFDAGNAVTVKCFVKDSASWAYLHARDSFSCHSFDDETNCWTYTGTPQVIGNHWIWVGLIYIKTVMDKEEPDRSYLWGVPYVVE